MLFKQDDEEVLGISTAQEAEAFLKKEFPNILKKMPQSEIKAFVERPAGKLPYFRYCGPDLHYSSSVVLAGDAVHTVRAKELCSAQHMAYERWYSRNPFSCNRCTKHGPVPALATLLLP